MSPTVVIHGSTRGIGLSLVKRFLLSTDYNVVATTRGNPMEHVLNENNNNYRERLTIVHMDCTDEKSYAQVSSSLKSIKMFFNVAGLFVGAEKKSQGIDLENTVKMFQVNTYGLALSVKHFSPLVECDNKSPGIFVNLTARIASLTENSVSGWNSYRASKIAANMYMRCLGVEFKRKGSGCSAYSIYPGITDTDMFRNSRLTLSGAPQIPIQSADEAAAKIFDLCTVNNPMIFNSKIVTTDGKDVNF